MLRPPLVLRISLPHEQAIPGASLATAIIHGLDDLGRKLAYGHPYDELSRIGLAYNAGTVDVRARSQLPPMQAITFTYLSRILKVIWDLSVEYGYLTWKFDVFQIKDTSETLIGNVALHYDP